MIRHITTYYVNGDIRDATIEKFNTNVSKNTWEQITVILFSFNELRDSIELVQTSSLQRSCRNTLPRSSLLTIFNGREARNMNNGDE